MGLFARMGGVGTSILRERPTRLISVRPSCQEPHDPQQLVRKALLLVAVVLAPFAFSGASWDATRGWISKWAMFVVALILSKLVLVVILLVAVTQVSAPIDGDLSSIADPLAGVVLMALAGFAPYMTYRFLSFIGFDLYNSMGTEQEAKSALNRPIPTPGKPQGGEPKKVLDEGSKGGGDKSSSAGSNGGGGAGGGPKANPTPAPSSAGGGGAGASSGGAAGAGGSAGAAGAGAGGGAAAAGPVAAGVVAGAAVVKAAATAGPKAGQALAGQADQAASGAEQSGSAPVTPHAPPPSQPLPRTPTSSAPPPKPKPTKE